MERAGSVVCSRSASGGTVETGPTEGLTKSRLSCIIVMANTLSYYLSSNNSPALFRARGSFAFGSRPTRRDEERALNVSGKAGIQGVGGRWDVGEMGAYGAVDDLAHVGRPAAQRVSLPFVRLLRRRDPDRNARLIFDDLAFVEDEDADGKSTGAERAAHGHGAYPADKQREFQPWAISSP